MFRYPTFKGVLIEIRDGFIAAYIIVAVCFGMFWPVWAWLLLGG